VIAFPSGVMTNIRVTLAQSQASSDVVNLATQLVNQAMFDGQRIPLCPPEKICAETLLLCRILGLHEKSLDALARLAVSGLVTPRMKRLSESDPWMCGSVGGLGVALARSLGLPVPAMLEQPMLQWLDAASVCPGRSAWDTAERLWCGLLLKDDGQLLIERRMRQVADRTVWEFLVCSPRTLRRRDMYCLTHVLLYCTDFGHFRLPDSVDRCALGWYLHQLLSVAFIRGDLDLALELLLTLAACGLPVGWEAELVLTYCRQQMVRFGSVADPVRRARWGWPIESWECNYHATFLLEMVDALWHEPRLLGDLLAPAPPHRGMTCCPEFRAESELQRNISTYLEASADDSGGSARWLLETGGSLAHAGRCVCLD
jgi:uncharacterized protein DUF6895